MNHLLRHAAAIVLAIASIPLATAADAPAAGQPQIIVLKLDDIVAPGMPRWQRVTEFLAREHIRASFGILGHSLEQDNPDYFNWIKSLHAGGTIEFWNHGYRNRKGSDKTGEFEESFETQKTALENTQRLAREKLGIELKVFGAHWSGTNADTVRALDAIPSITMCFYDPAKSAKFVFPRYLTLENPTHVPDFAKFKEAYEKVGHDKECLALQGHPNSWDDARWDQFVKIIAFLQSKGCRFMTPSEYMEHASRAKPAPAAGG